MTLERRELESPAGENARGDAAAAWSEHYAVPAAFIVRINAGTPRIREKHGETRERPFFFKAASCP